MTIIIFFLNPLPPNQLLLPFKNLVQARFFFSFYKTVGPLYQPQGNPPLGSAQRDSFQHQFSVPSWCPSTASLPVPAFHVLSTKLSHSAARPA